MQHYLDNSATTKPHTAVIGAIAHSLEHDYGNPSSLHSLGYEADKKLLHCREILAKKLFTQSKNIIFTSGGTESNNIAIQGSVSQLKRRGNKIVVTDIEHQSVIAACNYLSASNYQVVQLSPNSSGQITLEQFEEAIDEQTILVSCMMVNNETGYLLPIEGIKSIIKQKKSPALLHVDAVQAFGKIECSLKNINADLISLSGHKIHGPKGAGALCVADNVKIKPLSYGGQQELGIRPGTQATANITGFAKAVELTNMYNYNLFEELNGYLISNLADIGAIINTVGPSVPYILNFSIPGLKSETLLHFLAAQNIYVSSGSACAKGKQSHVLKAMGLNKDIIDSAIRVSFGAYTVKSDIEALILELKNAKKTLYKK